MKNTSRNQAAQQISAGLTREQRTTIRDIAARHGTQNVRLFGSLATGKGGPDSDIDRLVVTGPNPSPWFPAGMILELEEALGRKVDVVTEKGLSPTCAIES